MQYAFEPYYPIHPVLKKHIEYYYFFKSHSPNFRSAYYSYPNITTPINIHINVNVFINGSSVRISNSKNPNYTTIVNQLRETPLLVEWKGKLDKITIVFKPLGLNNFITEALTEIIQGITQLFTRWNSNTDYREFLKRFYTLDKNQERIAVLEDFLISIYSPFEEQSRLERAIELLSNFKDEVSVSDVAEALHLNTRTFDRLFQKHLGMTPVCYKKIARFRHSLKNKLFNENFKRLTQIGYESNFYDQSYFNRVYKNLTGQNPKRFFDSVEKLADDRLIFQFVKK
jgi:AraC-like DNA-binding protein